MSEKDAITETVSYGQERAREKTEDMLTNTLIPLGNRSLCILGS